MKKIILLTTLIICFKCYAQDCTPEQLRKMEGTWKEGIKGSIKNVTPADLIKEKNVTGTIHKMISKNYKPTGCQITYGNAFGKVPAAGQTYIADPYYYSMYILRYLCDPNSADRSKFYVDISTLTTVNVAANVIYCLGNLYAANMEPDDFRGYLKLEQRPVKKDGVWYMGEKVVGDYGRPSEIKEYRWLITYGGTLPFSFLSRKEYLLIQKKRLEKTIKGESNSTFYNTFLKNINDQLLTSEEELSKPAISIWNDEERFTGFVLEGTRGSFFAVKPNLAYYRKSLAKSSPQFFTVIYKISKGDTVFEDNYAAIKNAIDFVALKNMLGK